jgi:hypothetical protein
VKKYMVHNNRACSVEAWAGQSGRETLHAGFGRIGYSRVSTGQSRCLHQVATSSLHQQDACPFDGQCQHPSTKRCSKPEAYCLSPLSGSKYEKRTKKRRLGLESMLKLLIHPLSQSPIGNLRCFLGGFGDLKNYLKNAEALQEEVCSMRLNRQFVRVFPHLVVTGSGVHVFGGFANF